MSDKQFALIIRCKCPNFSLLFDDSMTIEIYNRLVADRYRLTYQEYNLLRSLKFSR